MSVTEREGERERGVDWSRSLDESENSWEKLEAFYLEEKELRFF
jgi:hypothetical protein